MLRTSKLDNVHIIHLNHELPSGEVERFVRAIKPSAANKLVSIGILPEAFNAHYVRLRLGVLRRRLDVHEVADCILLSSVLHRFQQFVPVL